MATVTKDFKVKSGLIVEGSTGTINSYNILTEEKADAKGDLLVGTGSNAISRLAAGTNDYVLTAASGESTGLKWAVLPTVGSFAGSIVFEGDSADAHETTLVVVDPTTDRTVTIQNASGTLAFLTDIAATIASTSDVPEGSNLYFTDERVDDRVNGLIIAGTGLDKAYDDGAGTYTLDIDSTVATLSGSQTLTNKTINLTDNTFAATADQLRSAVDGDTGTGALVFAVGPTFTGTAAFAALTTTGNITVNTDKFTVDASTGNVVVKGDLTVQGSTTTVDSTTINVQNAFVFEGAVANAHETTLTTIEPSADRTVSIPDASGTIVLKDSIDDLTNKTLTSPKINENVVLTATATELNVLDGISATLTAAELNILDGVTSTALELNILDGVTSTAAELNILDGALLTTTELNYVDGVTSAIQTQLNSMALDSTITEKAQDAVAAAIAAGSHSNITINYNDGSNSFDFVAENGVADSTTADLDEDPLASGTSGTMYFTNARAVTALEAVTPNFPAVRIASVAKEVAATQAVATASQVTGLSFAKADFKSGKFLVKTKTSAHSHVSEILLTLDGSDNIAITEYASVVTNGDLMTVTADVSGADVRIRVTTVNNTSDVTVFGTLLV